jgi:peptidyl-prolyl cis-trans isomerase SurA
MRKLVLTCLAAGLFISPGLAQTLFTFGNHPVSKQEFVRVYQKNSNNRKADMSEPALRDYLNLYSLFRMKVQEAELQQLDTLASIQRELDN